MPLTLFTSNQLINEINNAHTRNFLADNAVLEELLRELRPFVDRLNRGEATWRDFALFWPPRSVDAYLTGHLVPFFGAGISFAAGLPLWDNILQAYFEPTDAFGSDEDLKYDFLTKAELAAQRVGANRIQARLRDECDRHRVPTASHFLLAALRTPVMITTNYDWLLEEAWRQLNPRINLDVAVNDADLGNYQNWGDYLHGGDRALLLKIHGCARRDNEQLVLTRADYRHHYRANRRFFETVAEILSKRHVLFLGFSHRDSEVGRIVDDSIFRYEESARLAPGAFPVDRPHLYSLQFDMRRHTPEIFAAKGLVALTPPLVDSDPNTSKSASVCRALTDLALFGASRAHEAASLENKLTDAITRISNDINTALSALSAFKDDALSILRGSTPTRALADLVQEMQGRSLASQGVYILDERGQSVQFEVPNGLNHMSRNLVREFHTRPYFRIAKSFREAFVSDTAKSIYNGLSTVFFCKPLLDPRGFAGLLFAACQVGNWHTPIEAARECWMEEMDLVLIDSEGVLLLPPFDEIDPEDNNTGPDGNEDPRANKGYDFDRLLSQSRRDRLVRHIADNIVPLSQDDDVYRLSSDVAQYSVVSIVPKTRWKLAVSRPLVKHG